MIYIYSKNFIEVNKKDFVWDVEVRFKALYNNLLIMKETPAIVKYIDGAEFIDKEMLQGKFGLTRFQDISTGSKALLISLYYKESKIINFIECGDNVLQCVNDLNLDCYIYINRLFILENTDTLISYDGVLVKNSKLEIK